MKKTIETLLITLLVIITATSCGKDEPVGQWDEMKWKVPSDLIQIQEGVYQVPLSGGTFTFICENYEPWIESLYESGPNVSIETYGPLYTIEGEWCSVDCLKKYVTITFSPTSEDEPHEFEIGFTAGDIFYYMHFKQSNRLY